MNYDGMSKIFAESYGDRDYELCLKNALKESLDENEILRKNNIIIKNLFFS